MGKEVGAIMSDYSPRFFSTNAHVCVSEFQSMTSDQKKNHIFSSKIKRVTDNAHTKRIKLSFPLGAIPAATCAYAHLLGRYIKEAPLFSLFSLSDRLFFGLTFHPLALFPAGPPSH